MEFLRDWFARPTFTDDMDERIAGILHSASHVFLVSGIVFLLLALAVGNATALPYAVFAAGLGIVLRTLIRKKFIKSASLLFSASLFILFSVALVQSNIKDSFWIYDIAFVGFILPVLVAGLLSGGRVAFIFAILASLIEFCIIVNQLQMIRLMNTVVPFSESIPRDLIVNWSAESVLFLFTAGIVSYTNRTLTNSLQAARQSERLLAQRNTELQNEIVERQLAEARVQELSLEEGRVNALSAFVSNVSHDLKTPLSIINTNAYLLGRLDDPQKRQAKIEIIKNQSDRLNRSIQDMLTMAQLDTIMELALQRLDLSTLVTQIAARFQQIAKQKQIALWLIPLEDVFVCGNSIEMEHALSAIIENALNYTPQKGHIIIQVRIETRIADQNAIIEIKDDGIGISGDDLPFIFDRLYRADKARSVNNGGTGLGLAIAQKIIHLHHGQISAESQPDNGTIFRISLPLLENTAISTGENNHGIDSLMPAQFHTLLI